MQILSSMYDVKIGLCFSSIEEDTDIKKNIFIARLEFSLAAFSALS